MSFIPSKLTSFLDRPSSFVERPAEPTSRPAAEPVSKPSEPSNTPKWTDHVKSVYANLKGADPTTTFKQAMSHAKATYKK
jgi:hypothetical protein